MQSSDVESYLEAPVPLEGEPDQCGDPHPVVADEVDDAPHQLLPTAAQDSWQTPTQLAVSKAGGKHDHSQAPLSTPIE
jgi:hypothetical protein